MLRKWYKLRSLVLKDVVVRYSNDTLGHALTSGNLKNLVALEVSVEEGLDPSYLDSDVYGWCTPSLEYLKVKLDLARAMSRRMLIRRKFFVNLPRLRRMSVIFGQHFQVKPILDSIPVSVAELKMKMAELRWFEDEAFLESLDKLLALFPNVIT
jgi:hypothetical protein